MPSQTFDRATQYHGSDSLPRAVGPTCDSKFEPLPESCQRGAMLRLPQESQDCLSSNVFTLFLLREVNPLTESYSSGSSSGSLGEGSCSRNLGAACKTMLKVFFPATENVPLAVLGDARHEHGVRSLTGLSLARLKFLPTAVIVEPTHVGIPKRTQYRGPQEGLGSAASDALLIALPVVGQPRVERCPAAEGR
jgi:hypothetical protein